MIVPGKRLCDLCSNEIPSGVAHARLSYPLQPHDRELLWPARETPIGSILGDLNALGLQPAEYMFEFCRACVDGVLPMLAELKSSYIRRLVEERRRRATESVE